MVFRITYIKPNLYNYRSKGAMQPLFAAALAANTPDDFKFVLYDDRIEEIPFDEPTDLVAISIETFSAARAYRIAQEFRNRGVTVVAGGYHPTLMPKECLNYVDSIITGDAERLWPRLLEDFCNKRLKEVYHQESVISGDEIKFDRNIFRNKSYGPIELVQWGRGCPFNCEFCSIKSFYKTSQICRPIENVVKELAGLEKKTVFFVDDNLLHNRSQFIKFLNEIRSLKLKWICQISITIAQDEELLKLMVESGCFVVLIGIETFDSSNLKLMNKQWNTSKLSYDEAIRIIMSFGLLIYGTFIFGYDHDTTDSFKRALEFAHTHNFFIANFNPLYPIPGSGLYQRYEKEGRLIPQWWLDKSYYYGKSMFSPVGMTPDELEENCLKAKLEFNSWKSILSRSSGLLTYKNGLKNLALFFYANYINRREVINKQGKVLGK